VGRTPVDQGGVAFGYLIFTELSLMMAPVAGLAGVLIALTGQWAERQWRIRRMPAGPAKDWRTKPAVTAVGTASRARNKSCAGAVTARTAASR
jgi:hypothetical protein